MKSYDNNEFKINDLSCAHNHRYKKKLLQKKKKNDYDTFNCQ